MGSEEDDEDEEVLAEVLAEVVEGEEERMAQFFSLLPHSQQASSGYPYFSPKAQAKSSTTPPSVQKPSMWYVVQVAPKALLHSPPAASVESEQVSSVLRLPQAQQFSSGLPNASPADQLSMTRP